MKTMRLLLLAAALVIPSSAAPLIFGVTVNTSSVAGQTGYLDFQFNPGPGSYDPALVSILYFSTDATLFPSAELPFGAVSGTLPGAVEIANTDAFNDYAHGVTLGSTLSFWVQITGAAVEAPTSQPFGSTFAFAIYDEFFTSSLLPVSNPGGFLFTFDVDGQGNLTQSGFALGQGVLDYTAPTAIPEPATAALAGLALAALGLMRRRRA